MKRWVLAFVLACLPLGIDTAQAANPNHLRQLKLVNACVGCDLSNADLSGQTFINADLAGADLSGANLSEANLSLSNLEKANLEGANLTSAYLYGVNLKQAKLTDSRFVQATLRGAKIEGTDFCVARTLSGTDFAGAKAGTPTIANADRSRFERYFASTKRFVEEFFTLRDFNEGRICVEMLQAFANPRLEFPATSQLRVLPDTWALVTRLREIEFAIAAQGTTADLSREQTLLREQLKELVGLYCLGQRPPTDEADSDAPLNDEES